MNYEDFKYILTDNLVRQGKEMGLTVTSQEAYKNNCKKDALVFSYSNVKNPFISPVMYIDYMYESFKNGKELGDIISDTLEQADHLLNDVPVPALLDFSVIKDDIFCQVINYESNKDKVDKIPHRKLNDLAIIYRLKVNGKGMTDDKKLASAVIDYNMAAQYGINEQELYEIAYKNTKELFPPVVRTMDEVMYEMMVADGMPPEMIHSLIPDVQLPIYVVSSANALFGATNIIYPELFDNLAEKLGGDLAVIPSSVQDVIVIPYNSMDLDYLCDLVQMVNKTEVPVEQRLSNEVYRYDAKEHKLTLATDCPDKSLQDPKTDDLSLDLYKDAYDMKR